jgi:hypothetical protein
MSVVATVQRYRAPLLSMLLVLPAATRGGSVAGRWMGVLSRSERSFSDNNHRDARRGTHAPRQWTGHSSRSQCGDDELEHRPRSRLTVVLAVRWRWNSSAPRARFTVVRMSLMRRAIVASMTHVNRSSVHPLRCGRARESRCRQAPSSPVVRLIARLGCSSNCDCGLSARRPVLSSSNQWSAESGHTQRRSVRQLQLTFILTERTPTQSTARTTHRSEEGLGAIVCTCVSVTLRLGWSVLIRMHQTLIPFQSICPMS